MNPSKIFLSLVILVLLVGCSNSPEKETVMQTAMAYPTNSPAPTQTAWVVTATPQVGFSDSELQEAEEIIEKALMQLDLPGCVAADIGGFVVWSNMETGIPNPDKLNALYVRRELQYEEQINPERNNFCASITVYLLPDYKDAQIAYLKLAQRAGMYEVASFGADSGEVRVISDNGVQVENLCDERNLCQSATVDFINFRQLGDGVNLVVEYWVVMEGTTDYIDTDTNQVAFSRTNANVAIEKWVLQMNETLIDPITKWAANR